MVTCLLYSSHSSILTEKHNHIVSINHHPAKSYGTQAFSLKMVLGGRGKTVASYGMTNVPFVCSVRCSPGNTIHCIDHMLASLTSGSMEYEKYCQGRQLIEVDAMMSNWCLTMSIEVDCLHPHGGSEAYPYPSTQDQPLQSVHHIYP